jgi:hypothetical protein
MSDEANFDQSAAFMGDNFPPLWWRLFTKMIDEGFTPDQALALLRAYIFATLGGKLEK